MTNQESFKIFFFHYSAYFLYSGTDKLSEDLEDLLLSGNNSDVIIKVDGQELKAHKSIIVARSPVFTSMFKYETSEKITGIVEIEDCEPNIFKEFLHYIYTGRFKKKLTSNVVFDLFEVADKYQMNEMKAYCLEFVKDTVSYDTLFDIITLSSCFDDQELMDIAINFVSKNVIDIIDTEEWQNFMTENPLQSNKLFVEALKRKKNGEQGKYN